MRKNVSLRSILVRNYTIIAIVPVLLFGGIGITTTLSFIREELNQEKLLLARALSFELDQYFDNGIAVLRHLAVATDYNADPPDIQHHLDSTIRYFQSFSSIEIIDSRGIIRYITPHNRQLIANDVSRQSYFNPVLTQSGYHISRPFISPLTQNPTLALTVKDSSRFYVGFLNLKVLRDLTERFDIGKNGYAVIVDRNGYVLAHPEESFVDQRINLGNLNIYERARQGEEGTFLYSLQGTMMYGTILRHDRTGWYLIISQSRAEADRPIRNITAMFILILTVTIAVSLLLGIDNRRKIIRPITALIQSAEQLSNENYNITLGESEYTEINSLLHAFETMSAAIRRRQADLSRTSEQYKMLIEHAGSIIMRWNTDLKYTFLNSYALELFEYSEDELIGACLIGTTHRETDDSGKNIRLMLEDIFEHPEQYRSNENEIITKSGKQVWIQWSNKPIYGGDGKIREMLSIGTDRSEYKAAEEKISGSLKEKEILLKEIHHRVKNNMQIISSLLSLQTGKMFDPRDIRLLQTSQNRVHSMSLIHEQLYESENLAEIDFRQYINELVSYISDTYLTQENDIVLKTAVEDIFLGIDTAIPLALIVNELISNAVKYAFPERKRGGRVDISLQKKDNYVLTVRDNGIGLPAEFDSSVPDSLGYQLITALIDQLQGKMEIESDSGTVVTITFA